jgi:hypothetical protein
MNYTFTFTYNELLLIQDTLAEAKLLLISKRNQGTTSVLDKFILTLDELEDKITIK